MKLGSVRDGRVAATAGRRVFVEPTPGAGLERRGRLPDPPTLRETVGSRLVTGRRLRPLLAAVVGAFPASNVWQVTGRDLVATAGTHLYSSHDGGRSWTHRRRLPPSSGPVGVLPSACCVDDGTVLLGEYPLGDETPWLLRSDDAGRTWRRHVPLPAARHVHGVQRDPVSGDVWVTTGDRGDGCRIGRLVDGDVRTVGGGSQEWRAVELAFTESAVLWGVDSPSVRQNRLYRLDRSELGRDEPTPRAVGVAPSSVYYSATWTADGVRWVAFSTAVGTSPDSTASDGDAGGARPDATTARIIAASSASRFTEWRTVASYRKQWRPSDLAGSRLPSANAYVFLAGDDQRGLVYNPHNTNRDTGSIRATSLQVRTDAGESARGD
jgi:hypothetical protein